MDYDQSLWIENNFAFHLNVANPTTVHNRHPEMLRASEHAEMGQKKEGNEHEGWVQIIKIKEHVQSLKSNVTFVTPGEKGMLMPKGAENPKERSDSWWIKLKRLASSNKTSE